MRCCIRHFAISALDVFYRTVWVALCKGAFLVSFFGIMPVGGRRSTIYSERRALICRSGHALVRRKADIGACPRRLILDAQPMR